MNRVARCAVGWLGLLLGMAAGYVQAEDADFTIRSQRSGAWSDPATWSLGRVPAAGDRVLVSRATRVLYDTDDPAVIRYLQVAGTLCFARDRDTALNAGILTVQSSDDYCETGFDCHAPAPRVAAEDSPAALEVGTPEQPILHPYSARIRLHHLPGMNPDDGPAIVVCGGRMDVHGAPMNRTWLDLDQTAKPGDTAVVLTEPVSGWRVGDQVLITGAQRNYRTRSLRHNPEASSSETRRIARIEGATIQLDQPLAHEHYGTGDFRSEVANLSRNVIIESADPGGIRGHTMYHRGSSGSLSYARFAHLGKEGVLGRYPIHYHLVGTTMRGSSVVGLAIVDSHNRWVTIHGTQYLLVRDCVGYQSVGHGYFLEDATEVYNLLDRNLGVQAYRGKRLPEQVLPFDPNEGAAFWWSNGRNSLVRNVSSENDEYGFRYDCQKSSAFDPVLPILMPDGSRQRVDIRTIPLFRFDDNEAHTEGLYGVVVAANGNSQPDAPIRDERMLRVIREIDWTGPDVRHPHVIRNLKIWQAHYAFRPHSPSMLMENLSIQQVGYGIYRPAFDNHVYRNLSLEQAGAEPFNRGMDDASAQAGSITVDGLYLAEIRGGDQRHPVVHMTDNNLTGRAECHFRNVVFQADSGSRRPIFNRGGSVRVPRYVQTGVPYYVHDYFGPGRAARIVSTEAADLLNDGRDYRPLPPLSGDESVVAEVQGVAWPELLQPVDDQPPATVVLSVRRAGEKLQVRGVTHDDGVIETVTVNGQPARLIPIQDGVADWAIELDLPADGQITAAAKDRAGNQEQLAHVVKSP